MSLVSTVRPATCCRASNTCSRQTVDSRSSVTPNTTIFIILSLPVLVLVCTWCLWPCRVDADVVSSLQRLVSYSTWAVNVDLKNPSLLCSATVVKWPWSIWADTLSMVHSILTCLSTTAARFSSSGPYFGNVSSRVHQIPDVFEKFLFCVWPYTCCVSPQKRSLLPKF